MVGASDGALETGPAIQSAKITGRGATLLGSMTGSPTAKDRRGSARKLLSKLLSADALSHCRMRCFGSAGTWTAILPERCLLAVSSACI